MKIYTKHTCDFFPQKLNKCTWAEQHQGSSSRRSDCRLEAGMHPEGRAIDQVDYEFPWVRLARTTAELIHKFHAAPHAYHEALPAMTSEFSPRQWPSKALKVKVKWPRNRPTWPWEVREVKTPGFLDNRHIKVVRFSKAVICTIQ
jgi:hypothetical protein